MKPWSPNLLPRPFPGDSYHVRRSNPPRLLILSFFCLIFIGTLLLKLPWAHRGEVSWMDAAFTATSAVTVTGLVVVDTGTQFTLFGQSIILVLIQLGGIGLMTFAVLTAVALGFKLGLRQQLVAQQALNQPALGAIKQTVKSIAVFAFTVEAVGMVLLACWFVPEQGWAHGLFESGFYAVSAFNNAGFALAADNLSAHVSDWGICLTVSGLFIIGGLGYMVFSEVITKMSFRRLSTYCRLMLIATLVINVVAVVMFFVLEFDNPLTLGGLDSVGDKIIAAWFQGTAPRTAGFNTVDIAHLSVASSVMFLLLMFIGGAPNSTASGIKLSTFIVLLAATRSFLAGEMNVRLRRHSLPMEIVVRALALTSIAMMTIFVAIFALTTIERQNLLDIAFEVVSAFGTVGLSRGITTDLSWLSQIILMMVMLIGRVGPLTLGYLLTVTPKHHVRYAYTDLPVG